MNSQSRRARKLLLAAFFGIAMFAVSASTAFATFYYVSPSGHDGNPGTLASPFKTITKCATVAVGGDTCRMRAGTYREWFIPANGTAFENYNNEAATIDGTDPVPTWTLHSGNIYKASITLNALPGNQVFRNDNMLTEARYPNSSGDLLSPNWATMGAGTDENTINDASLPAINWTGATVHQYSGTNPFVHQTATVTSSGSGTFGTDFTNTGTCPYACASPNGKYYLVGKLAALDSAGEWYYDSGSSQLYVWAPGGGVPSGIEVKQRDTLIDLSNRHDVTIRGLTLFAGTIKTNANSNYNVIENITALYVSHYETLPKPLPGELVVSDGDFDVVASRENSSGILLFGHHNEFRNSMVNYSAGNGVRVGGHDNGVYNNLITNAGYMGAYATAISVSGYNQLVSDNTIHDTGRDGITIDWHVNGYSFPDNEISYNHIYDASRLAPDSGGIYACCELDASGTSIHANWVHDTFDAPVGPPPAGIYLDNQSGNFEIVQNVTWDNTGSGIFLHGDGGSSEGNYVHDNTSYGAQNNSILILNASTSAAGTAIDDNLVSSPLNLDNVASNVSASNNTLTATGADVGATAGVGCDFTPGCFDEEPQTSGVLRTQTDLAAVKWSSGVELLATAFLGSWQIRETTLGGSWSSIGSETMMSGPALASWSSTHMAAFAVAPGAFGVDWIYMKTYNSGWPGSWTAVAPPSAGIASGPAATSRASGNIELFVVGNDQATWWSTYSGGSWSSWTSLGGNSFAQPAVVTTASGSMELFALGQSNALYKRTWTSGGGWSGWAAVSNPPDGATSAPAVTTRGSGNLELFVRGGDEALWHKTYSGGSWGSWSSLGGVWKSGPAATSTGANNIEVFVRGMDSNEIWRRSWNSGWGSWSGTIGTP